MTTITINTRFTCRTECAEYCRRTYEERLGHLLVFAKGKFSNNHRFTFLCKGCRTPIVSAQQPRSKKGNGTFVLTDYNVSPTHPDNNGGHCYSSEIENKKSTIKELSQTDVLNIAVNDISSRKGRNRSLSTQAKKNLLVNAGHGDVSLSAIKSATAMLKITPMEHIESYKSIFPYFELWKKENPSLAYDIEPKGGGVFERLTVVMPYTEAFLPNMLCVFGLDAGFMPEVPLKGLSAEELQHAFGAREDHPIDSKRQYVLGSLTLSIVTGLTLDHSRILLAYCLSYGENGDDTRFLLQFLLANGGAVINAPKNIIMSDRGAVAGPVDQVMSSAIHHYCPKHLERNLHSKKFSKDIIAMFWAARCAKDKITYDAVMQKMSDHSKLGAAAATYLTAIPNWQLYRIVEKHAVLYELKSDNLVEGMFATLKEARCQASPIYATSDIAERALGVIVAAEENVPSTGFLTPRAYRLSLQCFQASRKYVAKKVSTSGQYTVRHSASPSTKGDLFNVNTAKKTCSCEHWQQSGVPCFHAWAAIAPTGFAVDSKYFYEWCHIGRLQAMFCGYTAMTVVNMRDVENLRVTGSFPTITPKTRLVELQGISKKRCRSTGDTAAGGGLSQTAVLGKKKTPCPYCSRQVAGNNSVHPCSDACVAYAQRHQSGSLHELNVIDIYNESRSAAVPISE